jgi:hypothetical protein
MNTHATAPTTRLPVGQLLLFQHPSDAVGTYTSPVTSRTNKAGEPAGRVERERSALPDLVIGRHSRGQRLAGVAIGDASGPPLAADPLILALAQLVRDRWAIEGAVRAKPVAFGLVPSIIGTVGQELSIVEAALA